MPAASSPARRKSRRVSPQAVPLQPVYLEWYDAAHVDGWTDPAKVSCELPLIQGLGFLAAESDDAIEVFLNVGRVVRGQGMRIPRGMIRRMERLTLPAWASPLEDLA